MRRSLAVAWCLALLVALHGHAMANEREGRAMLEHAINHAEKPESVEKRVYEMTVVKPIPAMEICRRDGQVSSRVVYDKIVYPAAVIERYQCSEDHYDPKTKKNSGAEGEFSEIRVKLASGASYEIKGRHNGAMYLYDGALYVTREGCCGEGTYFSRYDIETGKVLDDEILFEPFINEISESMPETIQAAP